jgi:hypothetical protein
MAATDFEGFEVGNTVAIDGIPWEIIGVFQSDGLANSELWTDLTTLMSGLNRTSFSSLRTKFPTPGSVRSYDSNYPQVRASKSMSILKMNFSRLIRVRHSLNSWRM